MLPEFRLERWLRAQEKRARLAIGGSGVARGDITPFLQDIPQAWRTHPDEASRMLRETVAKQFGLAADHVLPTAGASEADAAAILGLAGPGAHVVIEKPAYHSLIQPALAFGCKVERAERAAPSFDLGALPIRSDTKLVVLARPNNPTGALVPAERLVAIAESAPQAWILVDEVFADASAAGDRPACKLHPRILSVNSVTKTLGFSGLRCGWVAGAPEALEAIDRAKAHLSVQNALLDLQIAARVVEARPKLVERTRALRTENAKVLREFLASSKKLRGEVHDHGTTCVLKLPDGVDDVAFAEKLAHDHGVVAPPGSFVELPGWIRVGLVGDPAALREGLGEIERAL